MSVLIHVRRPAFVVAAAASAALLAAAPAVAAPNWTIVSSPNPSPALNGLDGVFARTATDAWAVGQVGETANTEGNAGLALHWNGTAWTSVPVPDPQFRNERLFAVDGTSANDVWAVGAAATAQNQVPREVFALHWNGTAWALTPVQTGPTGTARGGLNAVAAISPTNVWIGGRSRSGNVLIEHWNGTAWTVAPTPAVNSTINDLAVVSPTNIWAVGGGLVNADGTRTALIMHYDGSSWQRVTNQVSVPANFVAHRGLFGITALSATDIWAVGTATDRLSVDQPVIQHWNGTRWTRVAAPAAPANTSHQDLNGIAAVSATEIYAVGDITNATDATSSGMVLRWNGTAWVRESVAHSTAGSDSLGDVAATPGGGPLWAVGTSFAGGTTTLTFITRR